MSDDQDSGEDSSPLRPRSQTLVVKAIAPNRTSRTRALLTTVSGAQAGRVCTLPKNEIATLGRSEGSTFRFDDASVSSTHARIVLVGSEYVFTDNRSTNGSYVNDNRVETSVVLAEGDRVRLGPQILLRFSLVDEDEEAALKKVYEAALFDGLTGAFNRKHLEERLETELAFATRHGTELSVIMIDVDHFKKVNDTYGHLAGDAVLKVVARLLAQGIRNEDMLARYGGEEFVILARGVQVSAAFLLADRLRQSVQDAEIEHDGRILKVTASAGVASVACCNGRIDRATLVGLADSRLYQAKQNGRNRVVGP